MGRHAMLLPLVLSASLAAPAVRQGDLLVAGDERLKIALDAADGSLREVWVDGQVVCREVGGQQTFDLETMNGWLTGKLQQQPELKSIDELDGGLAANVACGPWDFRFEYRLDPAQRLLRRRVAFTWRGNAPTKFYGFWTRTPVTVLDAGDTWFCPGVWPPVLHRAEDRVAGRKFGGTGLPASCIAQVAPNLSAVWLSDERTPYSDRPGLSVTEHLGGIQVAQSFQCRGHIKVGETQTVGDAHLWFVPADGETALRRIHDWMKLVGHVVPADRPAWMRDAALYSFHPGGSIGSNWRDVGGFAPAAELLEGMADLGCNAVWTLPVEDRSPYHPRDYYAFMEGLGTGEEFRALVARAHATGLHVLQDIVPHGGSNTYPRALEHPEWLAQEEDGSTLSYWCFDFNWPSWQQYMAAVAKHYVHEYGVDGYRVDATSGSKIANWNPDIPYPRASMAQLQGGLGMLNAIRGAVKAEKPAEGGLLAETGGSLYGTVADAVYDFTACYNVFHGIRRQPVAEFVPQLRRWLHEQQYAEAADLLRLRHLESHDSLRSGGWYGLDGMRAMFAMDAWIHGIPMIYQEMETGHRVALQRILGVRHALPELRRGVPDYLSVQCPDTVFACLRTLGDDVSIALVNFGEKPVNGSLKIPLEALPAALRQDVKATDMLGGEAVEPKVSGRELRLSLKLGALGYTVVALRANEAAAAWPRPEAWPVAGPVPPGGPPTADVPRGNQYLAPLDANTGLPMWVRIGGIPVLDRADLAVDPATAAKAGQPVMTADGLDMLVERPFGDAKLTLRYHPTAEKLEVRGTWTGPEPEYCALVWPVTDARRWSATGSEGRLEDTYRVKHLTTDGVMGSIYWRPQGTAVVFDSLLQPFSADGGELSAVAGNAPVTFRFPGNSLPARAQWLDRVGDDHRLTAVIALKDRDAPVDGVQPLAFDIVPVKPGESPDSTLRPVAGGWVYQNAHYRLELGRNGVIRRLGDAKGATILRSHDLYTDTGYTAEKLRFGAENDVETAVRITPQGKLLHLRFEGRLRGSYRFDKLEPPIAYRVDYTLGAGPSLRVASAVKPAALPRGDKAFLAAYGTLPDLAKITLRKGGQTFAEAEVASASRVVETKSMPGATIPEQIWLDGAKGRLLQLSDLTYAAPTVPNIFAHGTQFFVAFQDGATQTTGAGSWHGCDAVWTVGDNAPVAIGTPPVYGAQPADALLADPGFEGAAGGQPVLLAAKVALPRPAPGSSWSAPAGGRIVGQPTHAGKAAAEVVGQAENYRLWRQPLKLAEFPVGSTWRLSAWVKGDQLARGPIDWQTPSVRFAVTVDGTSTYVSAPVGMGTYDWQQVRVEWTVPVGVTSLEVQVGQNGSTGTLWIDDVAVERVP